MKIFELRPLHDPKIYYERIEKRIKELLKSEIYLPLVKELGLSRATLKNALDDEILIDAIRSGRITFSRGKFSGRFSASVSKELKRLGATWDRKTGTWNIPQSSLSVQLRQTIASSEAAFTDKMAKIDQKLASIVPEQLASKLKVSDVFDSALWKTEKDFQASVNKITVAPQVTKEQRVKIADEWQNNLQLFIQKFTDENILKLRKEVQKAVFAGKRRDEIAEDIQKSYDVTANKAKFLARQESNLLMAKYKEARYISSGIREYKWMAVSGSKLHPVRPKHQALADRSKKGETFRFDDPPNTAEDGTPARYNNPKEDYNCRCYAIPIIKYR